MVTGILVGPSVPAHADDPSVTGISLAPTTLRQNEQATLKFRIVNGNSPNGADQITYEVGLSPNNSVTCTGTGCDGEVSLDSGATSEELTATLRATAQLNPGESRTVTINITVNGPGQATNPPPRQLTLRGPDAPQTVPSVAGQIYDQATGQVIPGAMVAMQDSRNGQFNTQADSRGSFKFTSTASKPIAPGSLLILASKDGYQPTDPVEREGKAGQALTGVRVPLRAVAAAATPTAPPPTLDTGLPTDQPSTDPLNTLGAEAGSEDGGGGMLSWLLIGMGGLLVALGIGAIALLLIRRRNDDDEDEPEVAPRPGPRPTAAGGYRGGPDPTMVPRAAAIGDRTMVTRPALADAPTAMHRPLPDEFPDPYNPPRGPQPGYGAAPQGYPQPYGAPPPQPYGGAYGSPAGPPAGHSTVEPYRGGGEYAGPGSPAAPAYPPAGGYGPPSGYEQGGYDQGYRQDPGYGGAPAGGGYGAQASGYPAQPNGYSAAPNGYAAPASGYESPAGYGPPSGYEQGGYDQGYRQDPGPGPGYGSGDAAYPGGYDERPGYDQAGGYDARGYVPDQRAGYEQGGEYYEGGGSRHGAGQQPGRSERRSLDWLDD